MDYIDPRINKIYIPGKGLGFIATENIPSNTIIIKETPITITDNIIYSEVFQLLYVLLQDKKLFTKFQKLVPKSLQDYPVNKKKIFNELKSLKVANSEIYNFLLDNFNEEEILLFCAKYMCNAFEFNKKPAILFTGTLLNHSCLPNVIFGEKDNQMCFMTVRKIKKGDEISDSYIDITLSKKERQHELKQQYGFVCNCERCYTNNNDELYDKRALRIEYEKKKTFGYSKSNKI